MAASHQGGSARGDAVTMEQAVELLAAKAGKSGTGSRRKAAKPKATKAAAPKKAAAKKTATKKKASG